MSFPGTAQERRTVPGFFICRHAGLVRGRQLSEGKHCIKEKNGNIGRQSCDFIYTFMAVCNIIYLTVLTMTVCYTEEFMRRDDREVTDIKEIFAMLDRCTSLSLGMYASDYPYVIPMTFGCRMEDDKICVYFHCAGEGKKWELLHQDNRVCVEAHVYERVEETGTGEITARYESVIGFGTAQLIEEQAEKVNAIRIILDHYNASGFPATSCKGLIRVRVYKVVLDRVSGKRNK